MKVRHLSIFLPQNTPFYRRIFGFLHDAFSQLGIEVSGQCQLLNESQMDEWLRERRPDAVFEMNRVKDDIPVLHEYKIPHIAWIVDFQGRTEAQIKGSEITYFFDPGWDCNYATGGLQDWLPPGTCTDTFKPFSRFANIEVEFNFVGHIPLPWSQQELNRTVAENTNLVFGDLLNRYMSFLEKTKHQPKTHADLRNIVDDIVQEVVAKKVELSDSIYYDLLERTKRLRNRTELLSFALKKTDSIAIYGSQNWRFWDAYGKFYRHFVECPNEINTLHQTSSINLHDGLSFHFRSIDCLASGGLLLWYDNFDLDMKSKKKGRGLQDHFENGRHYYTFRDDSFDEVYSRIINNDSSRKDVISDVGKIIHAEHTWLNRANKIINDLAMV
ncbi:MULTISPECIES: glycosyltransferase [Methylomonas]|nr:MULTISPECIES: glycosyltransferase [Methylomonas]TCV86925.1 glycosyl transferase family 1 [Methylomonas methanica]